MSVQVIQKLNGRYKVVKTIGSSEDARVVEALTQQANTWLKDKQRLLELDFAQADELFEKFVSSISAIHMAGPSLLLGRIFDDIGFNAIKDELFRKLVLARICYPVSKLKTTEHLRRYEGYIINEDQVYRYLDKLNKTQKRKVQCISYQHTIEVLEQSIQVVFYDVTTIYFEIKQEDQLRKPGFSKEGKHRNPQILLGLLVSAGGYPLAYEIFAGNKFEGHTMIPVLNLFRRKCKISKLVVVADAGLLSDKNMAALQASGYEYILGARIKNMSEDVKDKIKALELEDGHSAELTLEKPNRLIVSYSTARAAKDDYNRQRAVDKLEKQIKKGKLTKAQINNRGYNRLLTMEGEVSLKVDQDKITQDKTWDGLKGYITNTTLSQQDVIDNYGHLWEIEQAFRITKSDLLIRPVYHRLRHRIEAHICIAFVAYKVYKELERLLKEKNSTLSAQKAIEIAKTIYRIKATKPKSGESFSRVIILSEEQRLLANLFDLRI